MSGAVPRDLRLFGVTFGAIFLAELGDKTQLTALAFSANTPGYRWIVFAAAGGAMILTSLLGVLLGGLLARFVKPRWLDRVAAAIFLACAALFAVRFLMGADASTEAGAAEGAARSPWGAFAFTFAAIFVAELGDKTQLATLSLAAGNRHARWTVFAGASLALVSAAALACLLGGLMGEHLQSRYLTLAAAAVFAALGLAFLLGRAEKGRREFEWLVREIERVYGDERCRRCPRFARFLDHVEAIGSQTVSDKVTSLRLPPEEQRPPACDEEHCVVDRLHTRWHEKYEHEDAGPLKRE